MINSLKKVCGGLLLSGWGILLAAAPQMQLDVTRQSRLFKVGEKAEFVAKVMDGKQQRKTGVLHVIFTNNGKINLGRLKFDLAKTPQPIKFSQGMKVPGFLRTTLMLVESDKKYYKVAVTGFEPEKIRPGAPAPADFDQFWQNAKKEFRAQAGQVKFLPAPEISTSRVEVKRVEVSAPSGRIVTGFLALPKQGFARYPMLINVPGAGPGVGPNYAWAASGYAVLTMNVFPYHVSAKDKERKAQFKEFFPKTDYRRVGIEDRNTYFYKEVYLGMDCAIDAAAQLPQIAADHIGVLGSSQGGGSAVILGGLNSRIKGVVSNVTALCDHNAGLQKRTPGWPYLVNYARPELRAKVAENSKYFDAVNFAARLQCPARVTVGLLDTVCYPGTVFAMYNSIKTDKKIVVEPLMRHEVWYNFVRQQGWLRDKIWLERLPELPKKIQVKVGDLEVGFDQKTFWSLKGIKFQNCPVGINQTGSFYGNVMAIRSYGFVGTGHRENENEHVLAIELKIDGKPQKLNAQSCQFEGKKLEFIKRSILYNIEVISRITVENNILRESVQLTALNYMRMSYGYLAMYPWDLGFREYQVLDQNKLSGEKFTGCGKFLLNQPAAVVALYHPTFQKGIVSKVVEKKNVGLHREQYRDVAKRYRKHYSQIWIAQRLKPSDQAKFTIVTAFFPANEKNWIEQAKNQAARLK